MRGLRYIGFIRTIKIHDIIIGLKETIISKKKINSLILEN